MYALVESGGKQYRVEGGKNVVVDRIASEPGTEITLDKVVAVFKGDEAVFGTPYIENASVSAEVVDTDKQNKVLVFKKKKRRNHRKLRGHRQQMTTLRIKEIQGV